jgi:hypothetical protein
MIKLYTLIQRLTKAIAHRRDAEPAEVFVKKFFLCALCVSAVNNIKMTGFLNFRRFKF